MLWRLVRDRNSTLWWYYASGTTLNGELLASPKLRKVCDLPWGGNWNQARQKADERIVNCRQVWLQIGPKFRKIPPTPGDPIWPPFHKRRILCVSSKRYGDPDLWRLILTLLFFGFSTQKTFLSSFHFINVWLFCSWFRSLTGTDSRRTNGQSAVLCIVVNRPLPHNAFHHRSDKLLASTVPKCRWVLSGEENALKF